MCRLNAAHFGVARERVETGDSLYSLFELSRVVCCRGVKPAVQLPVIPAVTNRVRLGRPLDLQCCRKRGISNRHPPVGWGSCERPCFVARSGPVCPSIR